MKLQRHLRSIARKGYFENSEPNGVEWFQIQMNVRISFKIGPTPVPNQSPTPIL